jgi:DNA-binding NarL/FixJ family response regulator
VPEQERWLRIVVGHGGQRALRELVTALWDFDVVDAVGRARDGTEAIELSASLGAELVVLDAALLGVEAPEVTRRLLSRHPRARVVVVSTVGDGAALARCAEAGASACLGADTAEGLLAPLTLLIANLRRDEEGVDQPLEGGARE